MSISTRAPKPHGGYPAKTDFQEHESLIQISVGASWITVTDTDVFSDSDVQLELAVGTYMIESLEFVGSSDYAAAGAKSKLAFTGTATAGILTSATNICAYANSTPADQSPASNKRIAIDLLDEASDAAHSIKVERSGLLRVTVAGTLKLQYAQVVAIDAATVTLEGGSFIRATRIG